MKLRLYSESIGMPVMTPYHNRPLAYVRDILIDPENGKIVAFLISRRHVVTPIDVVRFDEALVINEESHISEIDDVLRAKILFQNRIPIFGQKVFTEDKLYLGRVYDMSFESTLFTLHQIFVAKGFLFFRFQSLIIPKTNIVVIKKQAIIIKGGREKKKERVPAASALTPA